MAAMQLGGDVACHTSTQSEPTGHSTTRVGTLEIRAAQGERGIERRALGRASRADWKVARYPTLRRISNTPKLFVPEVDMLPDLGPNPSIALLAVYFVGFILITIILALVAFFGLREAFRDPKSEKSRNSEMPDGQ